MKKYNRSEIMKRAHEIRKAHNISLGEALRASWSIAKSEAEQETGATAPAAAALNPLDEAAQSLFRVRAMLDRLEKEEAALEEIFKAAITESGTDNIAGYGWKASWKPVTSKRFDSKAFRADHEDVYAAYSKPQTVNRFLFGAV